MKLELKTEDNNSSKSLSRFLITLLILSLIVFLSNISLKLGNISKHFEIEFLCKKLIVEKSSLNFKKLSKITNQKNKQKIWDLCKEIIR